MRLVGSLLLAATLLVACTGDAGEHVTEEVSTGSQEPVAPNTGEPPDLSDGPLEVELSADGAPVRVVIEGEEGPSLLLTVLRDGQRLHQLAARLDNRYVAVSDVDADAFQQVAAALAWDSQLAAIAAGNWIQPVDVTPAPSPAAAAGTLVAQVRAAASALRTDADGDGPALSPQAAVALSDAANLVLDTLAPAAGDGLPGRVRAPDHRVTVADGRLLIAFPSVDGAAPLTVSAAVGVAPDLPSAAPTLSLTVLSEQLTELAAGGDDLLSADDLAGLSEQCADEDAAACDLLFWLAPLGSDEETLGAACGVDGADPTPGACDDR